jgi:hypothetical protein
MLCPHSAASTEEQGRRRRSPDLRLAMSGTQPTGAAASSGSAAGLGRLSTWQSRDGSVRSESLAPSNQPACTPSNHWRFGVT